MICILLAGCGAVTPIVPTPTASLIPTQTLKPTITSSPTMTPSPLPPEMATSTAFEVVKANVCPTTTPNPSAENMNTLSDSQILREFAGIYSFNAGLYGMTLVLNCDGTFVFAASTDSPPVGYRAGTTLVHAGQIQFKYETNTSTSFNWALIPVRWGQRKYLIWTDKVMDFCQDIKSKDSYFYEPRDKEASGNYLLRNGDEKMEAAGFPLLPSGERICP